MPQKNKIPNNWPRCGLTLARDAEKGWQETKKKRSRVDLEWTVRRVVAFLLNNHWSPIYWWIYDSPRNPGQPTGCPLTSCFSQTRIACEVNCMPQLLSDVLCLPIWLLWWNHKQLCPKVTRFYWPSCTRGIIYKITNKAPLIVVPHQLLLVIKSRHSIPWLRESIMIIWVVDLHTLFSVSRHANFIGSNFLFQSPQMTKAIIFHVHWWFLRAFFKFLRSTRLIWQTNAFGWWPSSIKVVLYWIRRMVDRIPRDRRPAKDDDGTHGPSNRSGRHSSEGKNKNIFQWKRVINNSKHVWFFNAHEHHITSSVRGRIRFVCKTYRVMKAKKWWSNCIRWQTIRIAILIRERMPPSSLSL